MRAIVSVSGGKDSQATALLAIDRYGPENVVLVMCDTGHEHPLTMEFVRETMPLRFNVPVTILRADFAARIARKRAFVATQWEYMGVPLAHIDRALEALRPTGNPYLDLCLWKGRFPSRRAQFCTQHLKGDLLDAFMVAELEKGPAESWQGVRRDESANRADTPDYLPPVLDRPWPVVYPIATWSAQQVVDFIRERGHPLNPLYSQGMSRVGCMPCINCGKSEIAEIARRFPEEIARVREWERLVSMAAKRGTTSFFPDPHDAEGGRSRRFRPQGAEGYAGIDEVVTWARTMRGGRQLDLEKFAPAPLCSSLYGLCE